MIQPLRPAYSAPFTPDRLAVVVPAPHVDDISAAWAWEGSTGQGVKVAVLDSGIDAAHPGIGGRVSGYVSIGEGPDAAFQMKTGLRALAANVSREVHDVERS